MGKIQKAIAAKVEERKKIGKITQRELAGALGCSQVTVSHLLKGTRTLNEKWIERFCDYLRMTLGDLEKPTPPPPKEPKKLLDYMDKLKRLYEISSFPAFKNVSRNIDDWLETAKMVSVAQSQAVELNVVEGDFGRPSETQELPVIDYDDPKHEHDAPREEIYEELPFYDDFRIPAGTPDPLTSDGTVSVRQVVRHLAKGNRYVIRVRGDSMEPRIQDGDLLLVDYSKEPQPGNIVIALIEGSAVVKKYLRQMDGVILHSTNSRYPDIEVQETDQFRIAGVVLRIVEGAL